MLTDLLDPVEPGQHAVQFYARPDALVSSVTSFVGGGLAAGETAIVLATPEHGSAFAGALGAAGVDVAAVVDEGRYHVLDAAERLPGFALETFAAEVGPLVAGLAAEGPLRVYGEMVAVLWDDGQPEEALEVEAFWNAMLSRVPFTLFCAYGGDARAAVTATHGVVVPDPRPLPRHPGRAVRRFEPTLRAVPMARAFVAETLSGWGLAVEPSTLVVTELATNAVEHTQGRFQVSLARLGDVVRVAVSDRSPDPLPIVPDAPPTATGGRGLLLVDTLATRWGCDTHETGKTVWVLVDAPRLR